MSTAQINTKLLPGAARAADVEVVAIASRDAAKARAFADHWSIPRSYESYVELLADDGVDAVYIPLPNGLHHRWTMRALAAGKHVLCEKPYSRNPAEVREAFTLAAERGLVLSEAFMYRYHPQIVELARVVEGGAAIGPLRLITAAFSWPTGVSGDVRLDPALDGGSLMDVGAYCLSAARLLAGEPLAVTAQSVTGPSGVDVTFAATIAFADEVLAHFDCGFHLPDRSALEVVGTQGSIVVADPWHGAEPGLVLRRLDEAPVTLPVERANSYQLELEEFGRAVRGEPNRLLGRADALGQATSIEALYRSAADGAPVPLTRP